jgi:hypothetical protein
MDCGQVEPIGFDPSGEHLYTTGSLQWPVRIADSTIRIGPPRRLLADSEADGYDLAADGKRLAVVSRGKRTLTLLETDHPAQQVSYPVLAQAKYVALSPDGRWAVVTTWHGSGGEVLDLEAGAVMARLDIKGQSLPKFSPDGRWLTVRDWSGLSFFRPDTWQEVYRFNVGLGSHVGFSSDGRLAAYTDDRIAVHLMDTNAFNELAVFEPPDTLAITEAPSFVNDSTLALFTVRGALLQLWDLRRIRSTLASMGLDWNHPPLPPAPATGPLQPLRLEADLGVLADSAANSEPAQP